MSQNLEVNLKTVAGVLARALQEAGVEIVFGLPGGENTELLDALRQQGIRFVLVANENSALFMADATARLTRKPGACLTTLGPGAANAVSGVGHAYLDRAPVLFMTAQKPDSLLPDYTHQVIDLHALFRPITKGSFKLTPHNARETIQTALARLTVGRPGPVHLQLSNEDAGRHAESGDPLAGPPQAETPPSPAPAGVTAARQLLVQARRPVLVVGLGIEPEAPYPALQELAQAAGAPVITLPKSKGSLPAGHPLLAGAIGLTHTDPAYQILDEADCIVAVGLDVVELVKPWQQPAPLIWVAPWPNVEPQLPARFEFVGSIRPVLQQLTAAEFSPLPGWGAARVARLREELARRPLPAPAPARLLPQTVLQIVRQHTPADTLLTTDVGSHKILTGLEWPAFVPNRYLLSNGLSSMGFGLPAAIAGSLVLPGQPVVCLTGDAGMAMVLGELGLLAHLQSPVIVVVMNDGALDLIRSAQVRAGKQVYGTEFENPDFVAIAAAYGIEGYRVGNITECTQAVQAAVTSGRPALIEAMIDPASYPTTPSPG